MTALPSDSEISSAVKDLFSATASCQRTARWNALVPTDTQSSMPFPQAHKQVTHVPTLEAREIVEFILDIDALLDDRNSSPEPRVRMMLMGYSHIMESELMPALIWNQLRLLHGLAPSWRFTRTTKNGITKTCWLPKDKYNEIASLAQPVRQRIGDIVSFVWDARLRNAFSHSRYWLGVTHVVASGDLSPISREGAFGGGVSFPFDEVRERYRAAKVLMLQVAEEHAKACKAYK